MQVTNDFISRHRLRMSAKAISVTGHLKVGYSLPTNTVRLFHIPLSNKLDAIQYH